MWQIAADAFFLPYRRCWKSTLEGLFECPLWVESGHYEPGRIAGSKLGRIGMLGEIETLSFTATCPNKHMPTQKFERAFLAECLRTGKAIRFSCITCDEHWTANPTARERI